MSSEQAIYQGCLIRFRPIMMTTLAAMLGAVPIAVGYGAGGEARRPLDWWWLAGCSSRKLVTLYLTPVFSSIWPQLQTWLKTRRVAPEPQRPLTSQPKSVQLDGVMFVAGGGCVCMCTRTFRVPMPSVLPSN